MVGAVVFCGCSTDTEDPYLYNPLDPVFGADIPVPDSVSVTVGDNAVRLTWGLPEGESADEYAVFRRQIDPDPEDETLLGQVSDPEYTDTRVRNGRTYGYRIAAGVDGQFGRRTEEVEAKPGLFSIIISNGARLTNTRSVSVTYAVASTQAIKLSEDPDQFTGTWQAATGSTPWTLSAGDGEKTVYAQFRLSDGSGSLPVSDTIRLDTKAAIQSFAFPGSNVRSPGDTIHFELVAGELNGSATVTVESVFDSAPLFDDGTNGDEAAGDGTYARDLTIPASAAVLNEEAIGAFTDEAGNAATRVTAPELLTVRKAPSPVDLLDPVVSEPPDDPAVTLRWSLSDAPAFAAYRILRSESAPVDSTDELIHTETRSTALEFKDGDVIEGRNYYYRVYVVDTYGLETGSNMIQAPVPNVRPPNPVTMKAPSASSTTRLALEWSKSEDLDFLAYRVYRNESGAVSEDDQLIAELSDVDRTFWDDTGLRENTEYYYRVYSSDQGELRARSNEVSARTQNEAPPAVTLTEASAIDSTTAVLTWEESTAHDFAYYRLYRDEIPTVTTASTLAVEMDNKTFTSYRDTDLSSGAQYYYRVFVVDDAEDPESTGSNTMSLVTH
jgi:fibronectin type 3 domain-containing protein